MRDRIILPITPVPSPVAPPPVPRSTLVHLLVTGTAPLAPRPRTALEQYRAWAQMLDVPFREHTPEQLATSLRQVRALVSAAMNPNVMIPEAADVHA